MKTSLQDDEFKDFLQQQVSDHRMYPSDKLWRNIQSTLHGESRWPALTYISIFIIASLVVSTLLVKPEERMNKNAATYAKEITAASANKNTVPEASPAQQLYAETITLQTIESVTKKIEGNTVAVTSYNFSEAVTVNTQSPPAIAQPTLTKDIKQSLPVADYIMTSANNTEEAIVTKATKPASKYFNAFGLTDFAPFKIAPASAHTSTQLMNDEIWRNFPLLSTTDVIKKKLPKLTFQFYITPSVSYRRLTDAKGNAAQPYTAIPMSANYQIAVNQIIKHRPSMGAEVGVALGYNISSALIVKAGMQFNVRQYKIEAYAENVPQPDAITANVIGGNNDTAMSTDGGYSISPLHPQTSHPLVLNNRYYELAAPIGVDWKILQAQNGKLTVNVAATVQPTYTFDKEPFVISTNYKNYTDGSAIMRNWNLNSSAEAYISYKLGPLRWQIGPQLRYQHLSTYANYPIREHLFDYGVKIGFTKSLN